MPRPPKYGYYEFFAGGGMARAGLAGSWDCLFANDIDPKKARTYEANWPGAPFKLCSVQGLKTSDLPGEADLAWASFPCQDLSLAGDGAGLAGRRSGVFWSFWRLMRDLNRAGRPPKTIVIENVCGALSSHGGKDFAAICAALAQEGYRFGALVIDAARFVPQSRPRLFIISVRSEFAIPPELLASEPAAIWAPRSLRAAHRALPPRLSAASLWWRLSEPPLRKSTLSDIVEVAPNSTPWDDPGETERLLNMMSPNNLAKVEEAMAAGERRIGGLYRRTRTDRSGNKVQRAEVRFDDVAGCLRTPAGGSSRQRLLFVEGNRIRSRLISPRETARLMGLPDSYELPAQNSVAYRLTGDGVVVPVVRHLAAHLLEPILDAQRRRQDREAA
ncbi:MAG: DNA cytosine methyltransferase [Parvularculaceae bacterium]